MTQNWAIHRHWDFFVSKCVIRHGDVQLQVVRMTVCEENSMDFCITTLGFEMKETGVLSL